SDGRAVSNLVQVRQDGNIELDSLMPGEYRLLSAAPVRGLYLKEATYGGDDVLNGPLNFVARSQGTLQVLLSARVAEVEGAVTDNNSRPAGRVTVVLVPDRFDRLDRYAVASTDALGRFKMESVAPGDYLAFGWESFEGYSWLDPSVLR